MGVVVGEEAHRTVERVSAAVEVVGVQPLVVLTYSHAGPVSVGYRYLLVLTVGALLNAEVEDGVGEGRSGAEQHAVQSNVVSERVGAGLDALVVGADDLVEIARRTVDHALVHVVVLVPRRAVVGAQRVAVPVLQLVVPVCWTPTYAPTGRRVGNQPRGTHTHALVHPAAQSAGSPVVEQTELGAVRSAFHQGLYGVVAT